MRCGTKRFEVTVKKDNRIATQEICARDQIDARKICRRMFDSDEVIISVRKKK
ncbi:MULTISPECIES: hypothetical protein [Jeotgalicoccus]|jgi:hypothetical protein|uniref:Uncharacterized protein n=1 Tax=Jeotgalicoccus nanhaiensis TaxID=568603 RepID=A0ABR9XYH6_9STAP|nr:hypothetical protein [Jeotgalicoccus nanhaiensis]MBF0753851.1 hypothetical protein [Jeotgalicoccus nanhaiensis]